MDNLNGKAREIAERYANGFVTDSQLTRYKELGVITESEYDIIYNLKH